MKKRQASIFTLNPKNITAWGEQFEILGLESVTALFLFHYKLNQILLWERRTLHNLPHIQRVVFLAKLLEVQHLESTGSNPLEA